MKIPKVIPALGAFFVLAVGLSACGASGGVPGNSVAAMASNPITTAAFNHWMFVAAKGQASQQPGSPVIVPNDPPNFTGCIAQVRKAIPSYAKTSAATLKGLCAQDFQSLSSQVMDFLIRAYWYEAEANKLGIKISQKTFSQQYAAAKQQSFPTPAQFNSFLSSTGQTVQDLEFKVRVNTIFKRLVSRYTKPVTAAEIQAYYNAHQTQFGTPESASLNFVRTSSAANAAAAKAALASGQSWKVVAKKYSLDTATKNSAGVLSGVTNGQEEAAFNTAIFRAPANKVVGPVKGQFGFYVFEVTKIVKGSQQTLAQAQGAVKNGLTQQRQQAAQTKVDAAAKASWFKKTVCRSAYWMSDCGGTKKPKSATPTPTTPTQTAPPTTTAPTTTTGTSKKK
ncbi:MAG TPA: peptidyl-prolyl cis-trans isomerase [Solirubrobacteraceae bacterium]|jgi:foldase protein PrsA|nr:peptidyl-prolyl cis-trans isomerase [Solirubrobacteraceae bacterium]